MINLVLAFAVTSAQVPTGVPQLFGGKYYQFKGYVLNDSGLLFEPKDTASRLIKPGIVYRSADSLFYYWNGRRYQRFGSATEIDPTVSAWAKAPVKPSYTYGEISGTPTTWPWSSLTGVPSTFTPSSHGHIIGDVTGLSAALGLKMNYTDTASMLSPYLRSTDAVATYQPIGSYLTASSITGKMNYSDTASMLSPYLRSANAGATYVPLSRTITINGVTFDLSANRSWTVSGGSGLTSLNSQTGSTQTFATGTSGTDFGISSTGDVHTFNIPSASATARGLVTTGTQTFAGLKTFTSDVTITPTGSTFSAPRVLGMAGFSSGEAARWQFGDALNSIQNGFSAGMDIQAYWGIRIVGNRQSLTPVPLGFGVGAGPALSVEGTLTGNVVQRVMAATGQTANLQTWTDDANNVQAYVAPGGILGSNTIAISSTTSVTTGSAATVGNNVYRIDFDPASVIASYTLTLPASPVDGQRVMIRAGRQIAAGQAVVTAFTVSANAGQSLYTSITPTTLLGGDIMEFEYESSTTTWTRIK